MRPHWNRNHARNVEAANDRLRQRYEDRRESIGLNPSPFQTSSSGRYAARAGQENPSW
jgi:hypothetical protein